MIDLIIFYSIILLTWDNFDLLETYYETNLGEKITSSE